MRSPITVWRSMKARSSLVERRRLVEDRFRDRGLADVVQLGRGDELAQPFRAHAGLDAEPCARLRDLLHVGVQLGIAFAQEPEQYVAPLRMRRFAQ